MQIRSTAIYPSPIAVMDVINPAKWVDEMASALLSDCRWKLMIIKFVVGLVNYYLFTKLPLTCSFWIEWLLVSIQRPSRALWESNSIQPTRRTQVKRLCELHALSCWGTWARFTLLWRVYNCKKLGSLALKFLNNAAVHHSPEEEWQPAGQKSRNDNPQRPCSFPFALHFTTCPWIGNSCLCDGPFFRTQTCVHRLSERSQSSGNSIYLEVLVE